MSITINFSSPEEQATYEAHARAEGLNVEEWFRKVAREKVQTEATDKELTEPRRPLSDRVRELWTDMPEEVRAVYPDPHQIDHHVYGVPKR